MHKHESCQIVVMALSGRGVADVPFQVPMLRSRCQFNAW
jgi:hypothetical protein